MLCELQATRRIMSEAQRLNMVGGHFIWLWADTTSTTEFFDAQNPLDAAASNFGPTMLVNDTVARPTKMNNRDVKSETITVRATVAPTHSTTPATKTVNATKAPAIDVDALKREEGKKGAAGRMHERVEEEEENFSVGFDPFRLKQRQYDKARRLDRFGQGPLGKEKPLPANGLILGLHGNAGEQQHLGADSHAKKSRRSAIGDDDDYDEDGDGGGEHIFVSNQTNTHSVSSRNSSSDENKRSFSEPDVNSLDYSIDNNKNANENPSKLRKRTSAASMANTNSSNSNNSSSSSSSSPSLSSFVLYHHFKDFPLGLLALRPQRMNVDRHFIRATVRVFAATWAKIEAESKRQKYQGTVINAAAARNVGSSARNLKHNRHQYERNMRRKRNIVTVNGVLVAAGTAIPAEQSAHPSLTGTQQVNNSSQHPLQFNGESNLIRNNSSDLSANASANVERLNDRDVNSRSNSSNQNLSGLTKHSLTKSNIDRNVVSMRATGAPPRAAIAGAARNASEAIRRNYLIDADLRQRANKRQNTWWSLEKETTEQQHRHRNPDAEQDAETTRETPRYLGGCYGTPNKQDIKNTQHFAR